jgi:hypothetical protein
MHLAEVTSTDVNIHAGFVNAGGGLSGRLDIQTPGKHVIQPTNRFVIVNHLYE